MYAEYATFGKQLDKWMTNQQDRDTRLIRNVANVVARNIIVGGDYSPGSPVDTGFFRSLWKAGLNARPSDMPVQKPKDNAPVDLGAVDEVMAVLASMLPGDILWLSNAAIYGPALEYGHSQQAPIGFIRITLAAFQTIVMEEIKKLGPVKK